MEVRQLLQEGFDDDVGESGVDLHDLDDLCCGDCDVGDVQLWSFELNVRLRLRLPKRDDACLVVEQRVRDEVLDAWIFHDHDVVGVFVFHGVFRLERAIADHVFEDDV